MLVLLVVVIFSLGEFFDGGNSLVPPWMSLRK